MAFNVTVSGTSGLPYGRFEWAAAAAAWAAKVQPKVQEALRRAAPVAPENGGALRDSIRSQKATTPGTVSLTFTAHVPYAGYVVDGTQPHVIEPVHARTLAWQGPGGLVFASRVNHPGTRPDPFARRAIEPLLPLIEQALADAVAEQLSD